MKKLFVVLLALCLPAWSFGQNVERQRKAEAGDASEQYYMAHCYQYGWDGAPEDAAQYAIGSRRLLPVENLVLNTTCRNYISMVHTVCRRTMRSISVGQKSQPTMATPPLATI